MDLVTVLKEEFEQMADSERAAKMQAYMRDLFPFYGVMATERRTVFNQMVKVVGVPDNVITEAKKFFEQDKRELHVCGQELLVKGKKQWKDLRLKDLEWFIVNKSWWDTVDYLASNVVGMFMLKFGNAEDRALLDSWNTSENMWLQRTSIIYQLKYKDKTDTKLLSKYIEPHRYQKEFFIRKAIGWALREYSKVDPEWVEDYIQTHELQPLSFKEASRLL